MMNTDGASKTCSSSPVVLAAILLCTSALAPVSAKARTVHVLTQTALKCDLTQYEESWVLSARLTDDQGNGIVGHVLSLSIDATPMPARRTLEDGKARWVLGGTALDAWPEKSRLALVVSYAGDKSHGATTAQADLDRSRRWAQLQMTVSPQKAMVGDNIRVFFLLHGPGGAIGDMPLSLRFGDITRHTTTQGNGQAVLTLGDAMAPGRYTVSADFPGSVRHNPTQLETSVTVFAPTTVQIESTSWNRDDTVLDVAGRCTASGQRGPCVVSLAVNSRVVAHVQASEDGSFVGEMDLSRFALEGVSRPAKISATRIPQEVWELESKSPALSVRIPAPKTVSTGWYFLPFLLCATLWGVYRFARTQPLRRVIAWLRERRTVPQQPVLDGLGQSPVFVPGVRTEATGASSYRIVGSVVDAYTDQGVGECMVSWSDGRATQTLHTSMNGTFAIEPFASSPQCVPLRLQATGYRPETVEVVLPHQGQWHGARVRITAYKSIAQYVFQKDLIRMGTPWRLGMDSPRSIRSHLQALHETADPTSVYEDLVFGPKDDASQANVRALFERLSRLRDHQRQEGRG